MVTETAKKPITKYLTERQLTVLSKRRPLTLHLNGYILTLRPKHRNQKTLKRILKYKQRIKELQAQMK